MVWWGIRRYFQPMRLVTFCFNEAISGRPVFLWLDADGSYWLAEDAKSWFRRPSKYPQAWIRKGQEDEPTRLQ